MSWEPPVRRLLPHPDPAPSGFDMMEAFGLTQSVHSSVEGVSAEPFVFNQLPVYSLSRELTQSTG